ncbi:MAG: hypothetical protein NZ653_07475 [Anaerolineae bacterium]|nr:hypothetical protein [Anaerolineae bacterium]
MTEVECIYCIVCGRKFSPAGPDVVLCPSCAPYPLPTRSFLAAADIPEEWQVGDLILGLYEVKEIFTTGAMGLVYRVHHRLWNLDLAVKSPAPPSSRPKNKNKPSSPGPKPG